MATIPSFRTALKEAVRSGKPGWAIAQAPAVKLFVVPLALPARLLILGAGPDALPVVELAARVGLKATVVDHRAAYAHPGHFPLAERVVLTMPAELPRNCPLDDFTAAVVMSHHLASDLGYLRVLADSGIPYVGLLGPASRRERLLLDLGPLAQRLRARLHAPVGLPLGGRSPESIALAIVAEVHAFAHGVLGRENVSTQLVANNI